MRAWKKYSERGTRSPAKIWLFSGLLRGSGSQCWWRGDFRAKASKSVGTLGENLTSDAVAEKVITTLASVKRIPADKIALETNLQDLGIDSLDVFTLLFELENAFKISIPDDDVRSIRTVNDVVTGIKKIIAAAPPDSTVGSPTPAD